MKFELVSDLHLFSVDDLHPSFYRAKSKVLVMLGDICESRQVENLMPIFNKICLSWETVIFIPGNHEFYFDIFSEAVGKIKQRLSHIPNFFILDNDIIKIEDTTFIGSTLWSDMENNHPLIKLDIKNFVNDYRFILKSENPYKVLEPDDTIAVFYQNVKFIEEKIFTANSSHTVVLTHHAPSYQSVAPNFKNSSLNGAFVSDLDNLILKYSKIDAWLHGHTHNPCDYRIEHCRVVCHPKGYRRELHQNKIYRPLLIEL